MADTALCDIGPAIGKNSSNIASRVNKGIGQISQIMDILKTVSFGAQYFTIVVTLRETMFINGILTNADVWFGLLKS